MTVPWNDTVRSTACDAAEMEGTWVDPQPFKVHGRHGDPLLVVSLLMCMDCSDTVRAAQEEAAVEQDETAFEAALEASLRDTAAAYPGHDAFASSCAHDAAASFHTSEAAASTHDNKSMAIAASSSCAARDSDDDTEFMAALEASLVDLSKVDAVEDKELMAALEASRADIKNEDTELKAGDEDPELKAALEASLRDSALI